MYRRITDIKSCLKICNRMIITPTGDTAPSKRGRYYFRVLANLVLLGLVRKHGIERSLDA